LCQGTDLEGFTVDWHNEFEYPGILFCQVGFWDVEENEWATIAMDGFFLLHFEPTHWAVLPDPPISSGALQ